MVMVHVFKALLLTWQKLLLIVMLVTSCSGQSTYYVTPTPDTPCPGEPCHTLSQYGEQYFKSKANATLVFLPGDHTLNFTISVGSLSHSWDDGQLGHYYPSSSLSLLGSPTSLPKITSRIVCTWPAGFLFSGITEVQINALAFITCGHNDSAALNILSVWNISISNCSFQNNTNNRPELSDYGFGGAIHVHRSNLNLAENTFQLNVAYRGGAIDISTGTTVTFLRNIFIKNSGDFLGGALFADTNNTLIFSGNIFRGNSARNGGALCIFTNSAITLTENTFHDNSVGFWGGALFTHTKNSLTLTKNTFYDNYADISGGAVHTLRRNTLTLSANTFEGNSAFGDGGALFINTNNTLNLSENTFQDNSVFYPRGRGGALHVLQNNIVFVSENTFQNNSASYYGGVLYAHTNNNLTLSENTFQDNSADSSAGALLSYANNTLTLSENTFKGNSAVDGGALAILQGTILYLANNNFTGNTAESNGGAILCLINSTLQVHGRHIVWNNTALRGGGIAALGCQVVLSGDITLENNTAYYGGGLYVQQSEVSAYAHFGNNCARGSGGGIYASISNLHFKKYVVFDGNSALNGGGLLLSDSSKLYFWPNTTIHFTKNFALQKGGAVQVARKNPLDRCAEESKSCQFFFGRECFFQIWTARRYDISTNIDNITELHNIRIYFQNNTALEAGPVLYGGSIDTCSLSLFSPQLASLIQTYICPNSGEIFDNITNYAEQSEGISSDPLYICLCEGGIPDCNSSAIARSVYPGGTVEVDVIAYGQRNGATPAVVQMITPGDEITTKKIENTQNITKVCTSLNYTVQTRTEGRNYKMSLYIGPCPAKERTDLSGPSNVITVNVTILDCPPGFEISHYEPRCNCAQRLQRYTNTCQISDRKIERATDHEFWVGYEQDNTLPQGLILHPHCPFDYCTSNELYLTVDDSDEQCINNRAGLLCGKCAQNFSLALGTNRCLQCSNGRLWLIVVFAVVGVALVLLLLVLRLTVAVGTINGLIFYANIVAMNPAIFFRTHTNVLTVFIAWLNLDLGIETCFYDGLDAYAKAWLQFVFPFYVWALVGVIIIISHYSSKVATILGTNPTAVLTTLFLLSYSKLLRAVIIALSYTLLEYPNSSKVAVWLHDGNIGYLSKRHIPLFIGALFFFIGLFLPYTLFLFFSQWLRSKSGQCRIFSWVNNYRVIPFLEAYHAPYTDKHRYWTGLMLLVRCALFLLFAVNALGDPSVNLLGIGFVSAILLIVYALLGNRIYKTWGLNTLELSFIANLCTLALATLYIRSSGGNQDAVTFTSTGIAFATFIGIVIYHSVQQIKHSPQLWRKIFPHYDTYVLVPQTDENSDLEGVPPPSPPDPSDGTATVAHINIRDLLHLAANELREPCLEMDN